MKKTALLLLIIPSLVYASGQMSVMDPVTKLGKYLKGGTGIDINAATGTVTATGDVQVNGVITFGNISAAVRDKYATVGAPSSSVFRAYTSIDRVTASQLTAALAGKSDVFSNRTTLEKFGTGEGGATFDGQPIVPALSLVATTGQYSDLSGKPTLATVAGTGAYADLSGKPSLSTVAGTGDYNDLSNKPTIPAAQVNSDWNATTGVTKINNKPTLATVATTGNYGDLSGKPAPYTLPIAGVSTLGGVKIDNTSIHIDGSGVISATVASGVASVAGYTGDVTLNTGDITGLTAALAAKAPIDNPTFTTGITTPMVTSNAADGTHYLLPYNSTAFSGTPSEGMLQTTSSGVKWYNSGAWKTLGQGSVTSITASSPLTGGTITGSGTIGIPAATGSVSGYLTSTDWTTFNGKQSNVGLTALSGNTTTAGTVSGVKTAGNQVTFDNNGNLVASAYAVGASGGGGSGTVGTGTQYHIPWYGSTGTAVSDSGIIASSDGTTLTTVQGTTSDSLTLRPGSGSGTSGVSFSVVNSPVTPYTLQFPATAPSSGQVPIFGTQVGQVVPVTWGTNGSGGSMPTGSAGIPNYNGAGAWGTNYNASNQIPFSFLAGVQASGSYLTAISDSLSTTSSTTAASSTAVKSVYDYALTKPGLASSTPLVDGTAAAGSAITAARADHVHPTDTGRQANLGLTALSGNTTTAATVSGVKTQNKQLTYDASGNVVVSAYDVGAAGGGGGSGTVNNSSNAYRLAGYAASGTTVSDSGITYATDGTNITTAQSATDPDALALRTSSGNGSGFVAFIAPSSSVSTPYGFQFPATAPAAGKTPVYGTPASGTVNGVTTSIVPVTWADPGIASVSFTPTGDIAATGGSYTSIISPILTVTKIQGVAVDNTAPTTNDVFQYNGTSWLHVTPATLKGTLSLAKGDVGLGNVENTALSTWAGSTNITTIGAATATSLAASGLIDGTAPTVLSTSTTYTLGTSYKTNYTFNNYATAGTAITYTLPTAAAGRTECVKNYTGKNGTLRVNTSAAGQYIDMDGTNSASGGYVISGGALGDGACFVGADSTHWVMYAGKGTWTLN